MTERLQDPTRRRFVASSAIPVIGSIVFASPAAAAEMTPKESANVAVVNGFCAAWKTGDATKAGTFLA